jgi:phage shock protein A
MDDREAANRAVAEHVARMRERLLAGRTELERQHAAVEGTRAHIGGMRRWIAQTEQQLGEQRARRGRDRG